ncbi:MAG: hypothetical protein MUC65_01135 [Pontiellaceae bacterium]|jgi:hypothetical protein|nr:hypothetical protein [Pontiellaceae bacterium]
MTAFTYAAELKKTFRCYGHFYRLHIAGIEPQLCRSVLEITSLPREAVGAGTDLDGNLFSAHTCAGVKKEKNLPDAVVIMMNPGSSRPIEEGDTDSLLTMPLPAGFRKPLVLTQPDNTQYQIMRIMVSKQWKHVRVLNISDLRDPKSTSFIARTQKFAALPGGDRHSLFSESRTAERTDMLKRQPGAPFILGWGQDAGLIPLAEQCLSRIAGEKIITVPAGNHPALTAHPSPMLQKKKEEWLDAILVAAS